MSFYYPQAAVTLRVTWENPNDDDPRLEDQYSLEVVPKSVTVSINTYKEADTFQMELDYKSFPFDPRLIRALGVTIHVRDMKSLYDAAGRRQQLIPNEDDVVFTGFADEETLEFNDATRTVRFEGRDFTSLFIDAPFPRGTVSMEQPLDVVLADLVTQREATRRIRVVNRTGLATLPTIAKFYPEFGATKLGGRKVSRRGESYWDAIQDLIGRAGLIGYIEIDKLVLAKPQNLYGGVSPYQFIYGKNLTALTFRRKLSQQKGFNVRVRSIHAEATSGEGRILQAEIPAEATSAWLEKIGLTANPVTIKQPIAQGTNRDGTTPTEQVAPYLAFNVPNVRDKAQLINIGEGIFEELGRQQIEGDLETREMVIRQTESRGSEPVEFDVRKIRTATPVKLELAQDELEQTRALGTESDSVARRFAYLVDRGYPANVAVALASVLGKYPTNFYTKSVEYTMDRDSGFKMRLEFLNFIELRGGAI